MLGTLGNVMTLIHQSSHALVQMLTTLCKHRPGGSTAGDLPYVACPKIDEVILDA